MIFILGHKARVCAEVSISQPSRVSYARYDTFTVEHGLFFSFTKPSMGGTLSSSITLAAASISKNNNIRFDYCY